MRRGITLLIPSLAHFFFPGALLLLAAFQGNRWLSNGAVSISALHTAWVLIIGFALLLAWRFHRDDVLFSLLVVSGTWFVLTAGGMMPGRQTLSLLSFVAISDFVLFLLLRDRGLLSVWGVIRGLFLAIQGAGLLLLWTPVGQRFVLRFFRSRDWHPGKMTPFLLFFLVFGLIFLFVRYLKTRSPLSAGGFWSLPAFYSMLKPSLSHYEITFRAVATVGILAVAIVEQSFQLAYQDALTGLPGRQALNEFLSANSGRLTVLMVDIDHFKRFNDRYGHDVGDQVLKLVASRLSGARGGRAFRYGGEEFVIVFPGKGRNAVWPVAEEIRMSVQQAVFVLRRSRRRRGGSSKVRKNTRTSGKRLSVTVSIGIAETNRRNPFPRDVVKAADRALYHAKGAGRNRVSG